MPNFVLNLGGSGGIKSKILYDIYKAIDLITSVTYTTVNGSVSVTKNSSGIVLYDQYLGGANWSQTLFTFNPQIDISGYNNIFIEMVSVLNGISDKTIQLRLDSTAFYTIISSQTHKVMNTVTANAYLRLYSSLFGGNATYTIKRIWLVNLPE